MDEFKMLVLCSITCRQIACAYTAHIVKWLWVLSLGGLLWALASASHLRAQQEEFGFSEELEEREELGDVDFDDAEEKQEELEVTAEEAGEENRPEEEQLSDPHDDDELLELQMQEGGQSVADQVLQQFPYEALQPFTQAVGGWLGEARFNTLLGGFYQRRVGDRHWWEGNLGLGQDKLSFVPRNFIDQDKMRRKFRYKSSGYLFSAASRLVYLPAPDLPLYVSVGSGLHYYSYRLEEGEVFSEALKVKDQDFGVFSMHLQGSLGFMYVLKSGYFINCEIITLGYNKLLHSVDSRAHPLIDEHIQSSLNRLNILPPLNVVVGLMLP